MNIYASILKSCGQNLSFVPDSEIPNIEYINEKKILITGAAGSIGSALSKKIAEFKGVELALLDINESGIVELKFDIETSSDKNIEIYLTDVSCETSVYEALADFKPNIIIHCAAYKHISVLQSFPKQSLRVNIIGTYNVAKIAAELNVDKFILISSDKAVYPECYLGYSKRAAELIIKNLFLSATTDYLITRLPNILGSRGSLSELIKYSIQRDKPVYLTDKTMTRYFITIEMAVSDILYTICNGLNRNLYLSNVQHKIKIVDLIDELIKAYSLTGSEKYNLVSVGKRDGEKIEEDLMYAEEQLIAEDEASVFKVDLKKIETVDYGIFNHFKIFNNKQFSEIINEFCLYSEGTAG